MSDLTVVSDPIWGEPEQVDLASISIEGERLPIDEDVVAAITATIKAGNGNVLPPIHLWRKHPSCNPILVAGRNRAEAHVRAGSSTVHARVISGDAPEIVRAVKLCEIEENLNRRKLSPALRKMYTAQLKVFYEEQHPETKAGKAGGLRKARKSAVPDSGTAPAEGFTKAQAKRTGRSPSAVAQDAAEAKTLGDETLKRIAGTSLDKPSEIAALAAMDEQERQKIVDRAVAGEKVSAAKIQREANTEAPTTSDGTGKARSKPSRRKKADLAPTLDPRAWSTSTPQERQAFVKAVGRRDLEDAFNAIEPGYALTRCSLKQAWNAATPPEQLAFAREYHDVIKTLGWQQKW